MQAKTAQPSIVVGILVDEGQAHQTVDELLRAGFSEHDVGSAHDQGEMVIQDNALARADVAGNGLVGALVGMGLPEKEARACQADFAARRSVVTVKTLGRVNEAVQILRRHRVARVRRP